MVHPYILHPKYFEQMFYPLEVKAVEQQLQRPPETTAVDGLTLVIRSCNDTPQALERLQVDIRRQDYRGNVQIVGVDCGNEDRYSSMILNDICHDVVHVDRDFDFMPVSLAAGVERADYDTIVTTVGHAALVTKRHFSRAAELAAAPTFGGAYGMALPGRNSSMSEHIGTSILGADEQYIQGPTVMTPEDDELGLLAADCAVIDKGQFTHYYPSIEPYGFGGADGQLGQLIIEPYPGASSKQGARTVVRDPLLAVHHTHGFGPIASMRQLLAWHRMATPRSYSEKYMRWHPNRGL